METPRPSRFSLYPRCWPPPRLRSLQCYQRARLKATYADFAARPADDRLNSFFLEELYGPEDFTRRTHRLQQLHDWLARLAGPENLTCMTRALALQRLSDELDTELTQQLLAETLESLHPLARLPLVGLQLQTLQAPARALGWGNVTEFLLHGKEVHR